MKKEKIPTNIVHLDDYRVKMAAVLQCKDCSYMHQAVWNHFIPVDELHCPNCSNQSLSIYQPIPSEPETQD